MNTSTKAILAFPTTKPEGVEVCFEIYQQIPCRNKAQEYYIYTEHNGIRVHKLHRNDVPYRRRHYLEEGYTLFTHMLSPRDME